MTELLEPLLAPSSRTYWPLLLLSAGVALAHHLWRNRRRLAVARRTWVRATFAPHLWAHPSSRLDLQLVLARRALAVLAGASELGLSMALATGLALWLGRNVGDAGLRAIDPGLLGLGYTLALFVAWDCSRYALHRAMHEIGWLWELHQVHHTAEVLTPLTFHRVHPLEGALYGLRGVLVDGTLAGAAFWLFRGQAVEWTVLGVHAVGLAMNAVSGNLRHSHVWWSFGPRVERWLLSPAQHQLHHARDAVHVNYGTWLSLWDRLGGTLVLAPERPPRVYGLSEANHAPDDLVGALVGPIRGLLPRVLGLLAWLGLPVAARGQDVEDVPVEAAPVEETPVEEPEGPSYEIVVLGDQGEPRVAGSAYVVTEEELQRFEYDDVHKVLASVPGVYVRGEDGFGLRPNIGMRGANSDRSAKITLLEDGIPIAPAPYAAPAAYYFPLTTRLSGVEVFKGPVALEHGPQTIGGAVNLLTRPVPERPGGAVDLAYGLRQMVKAHGWGGVGSERAGVLFEVAHLSSGGFKELDGGGPTGFVRQDAMLKARAATRPGDVRGEVELKLGYGRETSNETYLGVTYDDWQVTPYRRYAASQDDRMHWNRFEAELFGDLVFGRTRVDAAVWRHDFARVWTKLNRFAGGPDLHDLLIDGGGGSSDVFLAILRGEEDSATPDQVLEIGTNDRRYNTTGGQAVLKTTFGTGPVHDELKIGARFVHDDVERLHTEDPFDMVDGDLVATGGDTAVVLDSATRADALALWVHDDLDLGRLQILPGARMEWIRTEAGTIEEGPSDPQIHAIVLPGIGVFGELTGWLDAFGGAYRGFSPVAPGQTADVRPETATNFELGARAHPAETRLEAVGYLSDYDNVVGTCTLSGGCADDQVDQQFNGGRALVYGVESLAERLVHLPARVDLTMSGTYTWTHSEFRTGFVSEFPQFGVVEPGDAMPYVPEHQGSARIVAAHPRGSLAIGASARSGMRDEASQGAIPEIGGIPPLFLLDAAAEVRIAGTVRVYANATNLTGSRAIESWRPFGARTVAPLQLNVGIKAGP